MTESLTAVVLAAGQGKRMQSALAKVLHPAAGRPLVAYPVRAALEAGAERVVVVVSAEHRDAISQALASDCPEVPLEVVVQEQPRGTGDAARVGLGRVDSAQVMLLCGDTPLVRAEDVRQLVGALDPARIPLAFLSCLLEDPSGYGRVLREGEGRVFGIREDRDLRNLGERAVCEVNAGVYAADTEKLRQALERLTPDNAQGEYYLTDTVADLAREHEVVGVVGHADALIGVNDRQQLERAERMLFERIAERHRAAGATVRGTVQIDDMAVIEPDAVVEAGVSLRGHCSVGAGARIDVGCVLTDTSVAERAYFKPYSVATESQVGAGAEVGPFAHLRPGSVIEGEARIGNFVETKKTRVRRGAKANHLAYLGDADVGEKANVGAGTIFCNYDGYQKHRTEIGAGAFIGSDSQLVAPVRVGRGAYVASGTCVTQDVPDDALAIGRPRQQNKEGYASRLRARLASAAGKKP